MNKWTMFLPWQVETMIEMLNKMGYEAYVVGGCVRDAYLGMTPHDYDIATSAQPEEIKELFKLQSLVDVGIEHGTVGVVMEGMMVEITSFRSDGVYVNHRRPESVNFTLSLHEDVKRRDFTMNAMAFHPQNGLIDLIGGVDDIAKRVIRTVGNPAMRFEEDALRILRALRFASILGFTLEEETAKQLIMQSHLLSVIAWDRKRDEFIKFLAGNHFDALLLHYRQVIDHVIPEMNELSNDVLDVTIEEMKRLANNNKQAGLLRLAILCSHLDTAKRSTLCARLKLSRKEKTLVLQIAEKRNTFTSSLLVRYQIKCWLQQLSQQEVQSLIDVLVSQSKLSQYDLQMYQQTLSDIIEDNEAYLVTHLAINGNDLKNMGFPPSSFMSETLRILLDLVMLGEIKNDSEVLIEAAAAMLAKHQSQQE